MIDSIDFSVALDGEGGLSAFVGDLRMDCMEGSLCFGQGLHAVGDEQFAGLLLLPEFRGELHDFMGILGFIGSQGVFVMTGDLLDGLVFFFLLPSQVRLQLRLMLRESWEILKSVRQDFIEFLQFGFLEHVLFFLQVRADCVVDDLQTFLYFIRFQGEQLGWVDGGEAAVVLVGRQGLPPWGHVFAHLILSYCYTLKLTDHETCVVGSFAALSLDPPLPRFFLLLSTGKQTALLEFGT